MEKHEEKGRGMENLSVASEHILERDVTWSDLCF